MTQHAWTTHYPRAAAAALICSVAFAGLAGGVLLDRTLLAPRAAVAEPPAGAGPGIVGDGAPGPRVLRLRPSDRFSEELDLTPLQRARFDSLMERRMQALRALHEATRPRMDSLLETTRAEIDAMLTPEQRQKLRAMREQVRRGMPGPGSGPPIIPRKDTIPGASVIPRPAAPVARGARAVPVVTTMDS